MAAKSNLTHNQQLFLLKLKEAAFKLKDGEVSDVITAMDSSTYAIKLLHC